MNRLNLKNKKILLDASSKYANIILDCDGVILDSNSLKEQNILTATKTFLDEQTAVVFARYFTENNGLPRETKIKAFFGNDDYLCAKILEKYNQLNQESLLCARYTKGFVEFLDYACDKFNLYVLSGGDESELRRVLAHKGIADKFAKVMGAPKTKFAHLQSLDLFGRTLYVGDSKIDYEVSRQFKTDFVFMTGYTQFYDWKDFFSDKPEVKIIENLFELIDYAESWH